MPLHLLSSFYSPFYSERGGISINQSCSEEEKIQERRSVSSKSEEGWKWEKGNKKKYTKLEGREGFYVVFLCSVTQMRLKLSPSFFFFALIFSPWSRLVSWYLLLCGSLAGKECNLTSGPRKFAQGEPGDRKICYFLLLQEDKSA